MLEKKNQEEEEKLRQLRKESDRATKIGEDHRAERQRIKSTLVCTWIL
jgi:hypothetical protein